MATFNRVGQVCNPQEPQGAKQRTQKIDEMVQVMHSFNDRIIREWLLTLDETGMDQVRTAFEDLGQMSAVEVHQAMQACGAQTPFEFVGKMFSHTAPDGSEEVVEDQDEELDLSGVEVIQDEGQQ